MYCIILQEHRLITQVAVADLATIILEQHQQVLRQEVLVAVAQVARQLAVALELQAQLGLMALEVAEVVAVKEQTVIKQVVMVVLALLLSVM